MKRLLFDNKKRYTLYITIAMLVLQQELVSAQTRYFDKLSTGYFNTVTQRARISAEAVATESIEHNDTVATENVAKTTVIASNPETPNNHSSSSADYKIFHRKSKGKSVSTATMKKQRSNIISLYQGESHPLTIGNVLKVMDEVGISNQLFVLAQSLLETGFYKSKVCKTKNNLFGLRLRAGGYMHFERWEDSAVGYYKYVQYKYKGGSYLSFLRRIGYAEDPHYITKVIRMSRWIEEKYGA